jgi:hypothetical protein
MKPGLVKVLLIATSKLGKQGALELKLTQYDVSTYRATQNVDLERH